MIIIQHVKAPPNKQLGGSVKMAGEVGGIAIRGHKRKKRELSEEQKQEIQEAFALFDTDKDEEIDYYELKVCFIDH